MSPGRCDVRWALPEMQKDALQQDLPTPDEVYARYHCLHEGVEAPKIATVKHSFRLTGLIGYGGSGLGEGGEDRTYAVCSLIPGAEVPIPKEGRLRILRMVRPKDLWEAAFQKTCSVTACINMADFCPSSIDFD